MKHKNWGEYLFWVYANLNMLMAALRLGLSSYNRSCFQIRAKRFKDYKEGRAQIQNLYKNNVWKVEAGQDECWYCGRAVVECGKLSIDHILPRSKGGGDEFDNLAFCCRECNSSKNNRDLVEWSCSHLGVTPSLFLSCIYLKLVYAFSVRHDLMSCHYADLSSRELPFSPDSMSVLLDWFQNYFKTTENE